ncbi:hypothetical protein MJO10_29290, partial [Salmonella enterica subsp. enterica serovar Anatum]|nr:hypothetical protein [Salmonella enterica subsp. enterica serovar Anatum]
MNKRGALLSLLLLSASVSVFAASTESKSDEPLHTPGKTYALAMGLAMGMLPILVPGLYQNFPAGVQMVFGN